MVANRELRRRCHAPHAGILNAQRKGAGDTWLGSAAPFWVPRPKPLGAFVSGREVTLSSAAPAAQCPHLIPRRGSFKSLQLRPERLRGDGDRRECDFREDDSVHAYHRATNADYRGSGFDRGHLAAAANHRWSQKAMDDTFYLSNVAPQVPHLNQNAWNNLEKYSRSLTRSYQNVYVCTGPLFLPRTEADGKSYVKYQVIGKNHVAVPTHFFKVLILEAAGGQTELRSYVMPNAPVDEAIPLERFLVPIESVERASGLLFVPNILARAGSLKAITAGSK
uniref:Endonuclease n=1 Tax=Nomascus leucogenys TaxID=61853 RepID=G1S790_NOMLE